MSQFYNSSNLNPFRKAYFNSKVDTSLPQFNTYRNKIDEDEPVEKIIQKDNIVVTKNPNIEPRIDTSLPQFKQYRNKNLMTTMI